MQPVHGRVLHLIKTNYDWSSRQQEQSVEQVFTVVYSFWRTRYAGSRWPAMRCYSNNAASENGSGFARTDVVITLVTVMYEI